MCLKVIADCVHKYIDLPRRDVAGLLLIDKPTNISSGYLLNKIKQMFHAKKAGHAGILDVLATGMLPVFLGKSTKLAKYLLNADKRYQVVIQLGISTNTFDAKGKIVRVFPVELHLNKLEQCLESFRGRCYQMPPMFSSIKYRGVPLYKYALRNLEVPRCVREIYIYGLNVIFIQKNIIGLVVHCSKGTYIRSIAHDLGECLGCGAHVIGLRRLTVGKCLSQSMVSVERILTIFYDSALNNEETLQKLDDLLIPLDMVQYLY